MTRHRRSVVRRFADRDRELLIKLFRQLGTDNPHEAEAVRGTIDNFLRRFNQSGADLIRLLGGTPTSIRADLAGDISALFSGNPDERGRARRNIDDLLLRHRKRWNDLVDELISIAPAAWVSESTLTRVHFVAPVYPDYALSKSITGWVDLEFSVAADGSVKNIVVLAAEPAGIFEQSARTGLIHCRYSPVTHDGVAITQRSRIRVRFQL